MASTGSQPKDSRNDDDLLSNMESLIGYILLGGVMLSIGLIVAGVVWHWLVTGNLTVTHLARGTNLLGFLAATLRLGRVPSTLVNLGIGVLMLTPYVRVLGSAFYFALVEHNRKYTAFTIFVLGVLTYTLFIR